MSLAALAGALAVVPAAGAAPTGSDGRAFELVSTGVESGRGVVSVPPVVNPQGDRLIFEIDHAQSDSGGFRNRVYRFAQRGASDWSTVDANPPTTIADQSGARGSAYVASSSSSGDRFLLAGTPVDPNHPDESGIFSVDAATRAASLLTNGGYANSSRSGDVVFFFSRANLAPGAEAFTADTYKIYRQDADGVRLVSSVPPVPDPSTGATNVSPIFEPLIKFDVNAFASPDDPNGAGLNSVPVDGGRRHVASKDGRRLYFASGTVASVGTNSVEFPLWLGDGTGPATLVSGSRRSGEQGTAKPAQFVGATPDATSVVFVSGDPLLAGDVGGGLYRFDSADHRLTRLTPSVTSPGFVGLDVTSAWASGDLATVYFVASSVLADGAVAGQRNAYVWHDGTLRFIADVGANGSLRRISPDGEFALFSSTSPLAGASPGEFTQLFRYQRSTADLLCASCRSDGSESAGKAGIDFVPPNGDFFTPISAPRGLSDDGHVFFTSEDRLLVQDPSGRPDVYEFTGSGVRLLSSGTGASYLADNTGDGKSVFFVSTAPLSSQDQDAGDYDLYVRREGGGFPDPPAAPDPCTGDGCQGLGVTPPAASVPASDRVGAGNVPPPAGVLSAPRLSSAGRRALARGASATVKVRLRGPGKLTLRLRSTIGTRGQTVASATRTIRSAKTQTVSVKVRLSTAARAALRERRTLRVRLGAALPTSASRSTTVTLRRKGR